MNKIELEKRRLEDQVEYWQKKCISLNISYRNIKKKLRELALEMEFKCPEIK